MSFPFVKLQAAGNDFLLVDDPRGEEREWGALAPRLCDRHFGAGGDGLLVLLPSTQAALRMRMYNPDGTEDHCGNGLRCAALYAVARGAAPAATPFSIETLAGVRHVTVHLEGAAREARAPAALVTAEMGRALLDPAAVPARFPGPDALDVPLDVDGERLRVSILSTGTAHTVLFERPDEARFRALSPRIERHPRFPERTSVLWAEIVGPETARVRIWERGVGETFACGTGACAVAVAAWRTGRAGPRLRVLSRGGAMEVEVGEDLSLRLTGPAAFVYEGVWLD